MNPTSERVSADVGRRDAQSLRLNAVEVHDAGVPEGSKKSGNNEKHMNKRRRMSGENDAYEQHHYKKIAVCS